MEAKASKSTILLILTICFLIQTGESAVTPRTFTLPFPSLPFPFPSFPFPPFFQTPPFPGSPPSFPFPIPGPPPTQEAKAACLADFHTILRSTKNKRESGKSDVTYALCHTLREMNPKCWPILFPNARSLSSSSLFANCGSPALAPGPAPSNPPNLATI